MSETIPDVVLRLARRHLPADAAVAVSPAQQAPESPSLPLDSGALPPRSNANDLSDESVPATNREETSQAEIERHAPEDMGTDLAPQSSTAKRPDAAPFEGPAKLPPRIQEPGVQRTQNVVSAPNLSHRQTAGGTPAPQTSAPPPADESTRPPQDTESFADFAPRFEQPHSPLPMFSSRADYSPPVGSSQPDGSTAADSFQPAARSATSASNSAGQPSVDSISDTVHETSRQLEQTARDLENSLTRLFATQIETLQRLRDRVDEQERRWVEQQAARRATL